MPDAPNQREAPIRSMMRPVLRGVCTTALLSCLMLIVVTPMLWAISLRYDIWIRTTRANAGIRIADGYVWFRAIQYQSPGTTPKPAAPAAYSTTIDKTDHELRPPWIPLGIGWTRARDLLPIPLVYEIHLLYYSEFDREISIMVFPYPSLIMLGLATVVLIRLRDYLRDPMRCRNCDYDSRGNLSSICPECGFDTYRKTLAERLLGGPRRWLHFVLILILVFSGLSWAINMIRYYDGSGIYFGSYAATIRFSTIILVDAIAIAIIQRKAIRRFFTWLTYMAPRYE